MSTMIRKNLSEAFRWAVEAAADPAIAAADWLARDIDPDRGSAIALLTDRLTPLDNIRRAKDAYKTMRLLGETPDDRRLAARLYAASIAAGLAHHGRRISRQSDSALRRGLHSLRDDVEVPEPLRRLASDALDFLGGKP